jgi:2-methylcitrate dehydratase PrpD
MTLPNITGPAHADPAAALDKALLDVLHWAWSHSVADAPAVQDRARELLLDTVGCALAGINDPVVAALFRQASAADPGAIGFPGTDARMSAAAFASCLAAAACWHEACEGLAVAHGRPGLHAIPVVLASALAQPTALGAVLDAVVAGYEIGGRLGIVLRIRPGMHVDGTYGSFAAVASACRLAGDTPEAALLALNHAACHMPFSLYRPITFGSTARNAFAGHGAAHGMASAWASRAGLGGPPGSIADMASIALGRGGPDLLAFPGPGQWLLLDGYLKPFPAVRHVHYGATAAIDWHCAKGLPPDRITAVTLRVYQEALTYCGNRAPATAIQAQFSLSFGIAAALATGRLDPQSYTSTSLADPAIRRIESLIVLRPDPALTKAGRRGCSLEVVADGETWTGVVDTVPGDRTMPLPRADVRAKFMAYASPVLGMPHAASLADQLLLGGLDRPLTLNN